jgi:hypothetical protein
MLNALVGAGYEIRDGMGVAWSEQGLLVHRKPNKSDYNNADLRELLFYTRATLCS